MNTNTNARLIATQNEIADRTAAEVAEYRRLAAAKPETRAQLRLALAAAILDLSSVTGPDDLSWNDAAEVFAQIKADGGNSDQAYAMSFAGRLFKLIDEDAVKSEPLGPPPPDPRTISFDDSCFVDIGTATEYSVGRSALHSGPEHFGADLEAAQRYANRCGRPVDVSTRRNLKRIKWTLEG